MAPTGWARKETSTREKEGEEEDSKGAVVLMTVPMKYFARRES